MTKEKLPTNRRILAVALPLLIALGVALFLMFSEDVAKPEVVLDDDLCAAHGGGMAGSATLLFDLRKPSSAGLQASNLLRSLSRDLAAGTELRAFALSGAPESPRRFLARLCKPYEDSELSIQSAKDQRQEQRDCDDLPAQLPPRLRTLAAGFCARRDALAGRIAALTQAASAPPVVNAYLMEAIEEAKREFADRPRPWALYLFSDMLQHATWYSHLDLDWSQWRFTDFQPLRDARKPFFPSPTADADLHVKIFYTPRQGLTDAPRAKRAHQAFWRAYFGNGDVVFEEQAPLPAYTALPLMDSLAVGAAAKAGIALQQEREETERLLAQVAEKRAALEGQRQEGLAAQQERAAREAELRRLEQEIQATQARRQRLARGEPSAGEPEGEPLEERASAGEPEGEPLEERASAGEPEGEPLEERASAGEPEAEPPASEDPPAGEPEAEPPASEAPSAGKQEAVSPSEEAPSPTVGETTALADREAADAPMPAADRADDGGLSGQPPCVANLKPAFNALLPQDSYPGNRRVNYGAGIIWVYYSLDEEGNTRDEEVLADRGRSNNTRPAQFDALIDDTLAQVRAWQFDFADPAMASCTKTQRRTATFTYRSKCVGAPLPSCRTILAEVDML